ncbi:ribokinase [Halorhabdus rudnickae]|uniref:ribokinase n=1 Tax=Halorhabdus rudnickae TaxID=1775544 RepID=UPI001082E244|nr:ribokinase [Halorhabdus rudnickae]
MGQIHVAGSVNIDVSVQVDKRPKPGETVEGDDLDFVLGGKGANQAIAASRLGSAVSMIGRVGTDRFGDELLERLERENLSLTYLHQVADEPSGTALITIDADSENSIVIVPGANAALAPEDVTEVPVNADDIAVSQFEIPQLTIRAFFERARDAGATTILNPAPADEFREPILPLVDYLVVNETETLSYSDIDHQLPLTTAQIIETCENLRAHDSQVLVVTRGDDGVLASTPTETITLDAHPVEPVDTTGAGDAFVGAFATALDDKKRLKDALEWANAAGAAATTTKGASSSLPTPTEIQQLIP